MFKNPEWRLYRRNWRWHLTVDIVSVPTASKWHPKGFKEERELTACGLKVRSAQSSVIRPPDVPPEDRVCEACAAKASEEALLGSGKGPIGQQMVWDKPVPTQADLPIRGMTDGECRLVTQTSETFIWDMDAGLWLTLAGPRGQ